MRGLRVILNGNISNRFCSTNSNSGFLVQIHNVYEQPFPIRYGHIIKNGYETRVVISPHSVRTKVNVRKIPKLVRRCLFQNESPLEFFR